MTLKKYLPHLLAIASFAIITFICFKPLFSGKVIDQSDIVQAKGMSKELADFRSQGHGEGLWTNSMFGGMPGYQISTIYPGNWFSRVDNAFHLYFPHPSGAIFMCFLGFFILLLCLEIDPWLAFAGALAYGFSSYFFIILEVGHNSKANAISYLAPLLGGIILLMRRKYLLGFAVSTLFMALELNANHVQISYYGFMIFAFVFAGYFFVAAREKQLGAFFKGLGLFAAAGLIGFLPNAGSLLATNEYGQYSTRGRTELTIGPDGKSNKENVTSGLDKNYAVQYSHGIWETFTFLIPNFKGGAAAAIGTADKDALRSVEPDYREQVSHSNAYFGDQGSTAGPVYIGAIVVFLAFLGLFIIDHPLKWPLFAVTVLAMMLSWGRFFMGLSSFFLDYVPGYNKFRAVSMILIIAELTIPLLAVLAIDRFIKLSGSGQGVKLPGLAQPLDMKKAMLAALIVVGGFCLLGVLMPGAVNTFLAPGEEVELARQFKESGASDAQISQLMPGYLAGLETARTQIFKSDALRSLAFIIVAAAGLFLLAAQRIKAQIFILLIGLCFAADLWPVATRYLNSSKFISKAQQEAYFAKTPADEEILQDPALDYRVLNLSVSPFQDATTSYHHKSIGGYHGAKLKKYDELIGFHLIPEINVFMSGLHSVNSDSTLEALTAKLPVLNMLNTRYMIYPGKDRLIPIRNPQANGNAWFVKQVRTVSSADSEMVMLSRTDTKREALIQQKNRQQVQPAEAYPGEGSIRLTAYQPNKLSYESEATAKEFAVFSEIYYPKGWNAYLDGAPAAHTCVDYLLRGMEVPAGRHQIEFRFEPSVYKTGNTLSLIGSLITLITIAAGFYLAYRRKEILL